ncbi:hypothetical protein YC2023_019268 [Brassica napus]
MASFLCKDHKLQQTTFLGNTFQQTPSTSFFRAYDSQGQEGTIPQNSSNTLSFASPSCPPNGVPLEDPHSPLPHFMCTELRTVMMNISVYGEMAFYVMPDEFFRTRVLGYSLTKEI